MGRIRKIHQLTEKKHLNLYQLDATNRVGGDMEYLVASRAEEIRGLHLYSEDERPDGVIIYSLYGEKKDRVVLIRQYRYSMDDYIYEFPAGLVDEGESYREAAARELREETGLEFQPMDADAMYERAWYTTVGITDERCSTVYGYARGTVSSRWLEDTEDIQVILADRDEVRRILKEEKVAIMCAYMLMHFLSDEEPFGFLAAKEI